jgi:hypothetical protein
LLDDRAFLALLLRIDVELAEQARAKGCPCGGVLHRSDYPRQPRGLAKADRDDLLSRFSFCCNVCRKRVTSESVRFLGRRLYVMLVVVLASARSVTCMPAAAQLSACLQVPRQTLDRWRQWWTAQFPQTPLWQASGASFMPPPDAQRFPLSLLERFGGSALNSLLHLLAFLSPLTTRPVALRQGR